MKPPAQPNILSIIKEAVQDDHRLYAALAQIPNQIAYADSQYIHALHRRLTELNTQVTNLKQQLEDPASTLTIDECEQCRKQLTKANKTLYYISLIGDDALKAIYNHALRSKREWTTAIRTYKGLVKYSQGLYRDHKPRV